MSEGYFNYKGTLFPCLSTCPKAIEFVENELQVRDDDIFNITFPKSGTTWMIEILSIIKSNGDATYLKTVPNWNRAPWIEAPNISDKLQQSTDKPRILTSHLGRNLLVKSFSNSKAKVIYTLRNPKDVVVSLYYFAKMSVFFKDPKNFDQFLKDFLSGELPYGSWFDHVKGWMELEGKANFLFVTYEDLQKDLRSSVIKICKFLGKEFDEAIIDSILENVTFKNMKENSMSNFTLLSDTYMDHKKSPFMRKGISGDWQNHFTLEQTEYFDKIYKEKMKDFNVKFPWDES